MDRRIMRDSARVETTENRWPEVIAVREGLIHAPFVINIDIVRQTVEKDLSGLLVMPEREL